MKTSDEAVVRAPARVNLIGEHTDYNGGFVLPAALSLEITARGRRRSDGRVVVTAEDMKSRGEFDLSRIELNPDMPWLNYVQGVALYLLEAGAELPGAEISISGDIPRGAGLSSSAALEVACALVFQELSGFKMTLPDTAKLCQKAENEFVGMRCGIMDQFACCLGKKGSAIFLDCRSLDYEHVPLDDSYRIVISNTMVGRELAGSEYNSRRAECEEAVALLRKALPGIKDLRDVSPRDLETHGGILPEEIRKRAAHVVSENRRVVDAVDALKKGDYAAFGALLTASHESLRADFMVSCPALDLMVELAMRIEGVSGSRMTGAGFGGCTVSLVRSEKVGDFVEKVSEEYLLRTGINPEIYVCESSDGAGPVERQRFS